jgi:hypothetical protein
MRSIASVVHCAGAALAASAVMSAGPSALGVVTTEFRIIERSGQSVASPADGVLNFAVQVRVTSPGNTDGFSRAGFSITIAGEPETSGTLSRDRTSNSDGTYYPGIAGPAGFGAFNGLPQQYGYLSGINTAFNGLINSSAAVWTQSPTTQDIGLITPATDGQNLLNTPGVDTDIDGNPDTVAPSGTQAILPASIMQTYFGAGDWIDLYRFRYTVSEFSPRTLTFNFGGDTPSQLPISSTFSQVLLTNGLWRPDSTHASSDGLTLQNLSITVVPAPTTALAPALLGLALARRRRTP